MRLVGLINCAKQTGKRRLWGGVWVEIEEQLEDLGNPQATGCSQQTVWEIYGQLICSRMARTALKLHQILTFYADCRAIKRGKLFTSRLMLQTANTRDICAYRGGGI